MKVDQLFGELKFTASKSSGPGGQHVNKVNTKVTLHFDVLNSPALTEEQRNVILSKLRNKINNDGVLVLTAQQGRSQLRNKEIVIEKLEQLLTKAFYKNKPRKSTKPTKSSINKRLENKKQHSEKKAMRKKV